MSSNPSERELVYCHQCEEEWYRDEHGLACPNCHSEFTEIIEADHDPRDEPIDISSDSESEPEELPANTNPLQDHHPWRDAPDPDEGDINQFRFRQTGPGRVSITGTFYRTYSPGTGIQGGFTPQGGNGPPGSQLQQNFASMLSGILGAAARSGSGPQQTGPPPLPGNRPNVQFQQQQNGPGGSRFSYSSTARIYPRDAHNPQPYLEPVDDLNSIIGGLFGQFAPQPPGFPPPHQTTAGGFSNAQHHQQHNQQHQQHHHQQQQQPHQQFQQQFQQQQPGLPPAIAQLFAAILNPALRNEPHGDAVYTQEALDRVISQLMEQNATGNAPGPASADAIAALPKKRVTKEMLGAEGRAECSICMDEVNIGEEVTELYCSHWFHGACVAAWLSEHDTCPHCRQGISRESAGGGGANGAAPPQPRRRSSVSDGLAQSSRAQPSTQEQAPPIPARPGSAPSMSESQHGNHYYPPPPPPPPPRYYEGSFQFQTSSSNGPHRQHSHQQQSHSSSHGSGGNGGIAERLRGLFGSHGGSGHGYQGR